MIMKMEPMLTFKLPMPRAHADKIKYHSPLPGALTPGLVFSLLDAFLHFKNFIKALLQCGKCQCEMHWRQIGISLIVKLLLLTDVLLCLLGAGEWNASPSGRPSCLVSCQPICWKLEIFRLGNMKLLKLQQMENIWIKTLVWSLCNRKEGGGSVGSNGHTWRIGLCWPMQSVFEL